MARKLTDRPDTPSGADEETADSKSARTRKRLLDAAAAILAEKGFAGTRLSDIAERAEVQAPAIYYYYSSREGLIEEVMAVGASIIRRHMDDAIAALPDGTPPTAQIAAAVEAHLRIELEVSDYARAIIRNANQLPEQIGRRAHDEVAAYSDLWRRLIEALDQTGQLRDDVDPSLARMIVLGALNWTAEWWEPDRGSLDGLVRTAQSMVLHALRP